MIPAAGEGFRMGRKPPAPQSRMGHGCAGRRKRRRRRRAPAGSWASCQDPPCFPARKAAAAALTQPAGNEPDFKCRGA